FRGGLRTHNGHRFSGSYDLVTKFDFEKMGLLDNAGFYFKAKGHYSDGINPDKVGASGAARVNSDVADDYPIFVKKWWYWHKFLEDRIELRLGVLETNKDLFDVSPYANHEDKDYLNRLSMRNATIPHGTGMGAYLKLEPVDWAYMLAAAIDAQSRDRRTGFDTAFHDEDWFIGLWEFGLTPKWDTARGPMPGRYRVGFWYDPTVRTVFRNTLDGRREAPSRGDDLGLYLGADQMVFKENDNPKDSQGLGLYARYGFAHRDVHRISHYWAVGASYKGLIPARDTDVMAFGVSQAVYSSQYRHEIRPLADRETVYEWYYQCFVTPWLDISPDLQIVTNPGGDSDDRDAIVGGVRIRIIF
ncbi:MAG: carbohydrate porin, partial [Phycisphaerae bacterium]|nr:carbohydrate porin [Phycisphaerae bacterium]